MKTEEIAHLCSIGLFGITILALVIRHLKTDTYYIRKNKMVYWIARRLGDYGIEKVEEDNLKGYKVYFGEKPYTMSLKGIDEMKKTSLACLIFRHRLVGTSKFGYQYCGSCMALKRLL